MQAGKESKQRGKPRGRRRDRDCGSCKARGVKCDLNRPRCLPCLQANLPCGGYPQRIIWAGEPRVNKDRKRRSLSGESQSLPASTSTSVEVDNGGGARPVSDSRSSPALNEMPNVDRTSFVKRLAIFCHQIESLGDQTIHNSPYLSGKTIRLVSSLREFMQARIKRFPTTARTDEALPESAEAARYRLALLMELNEALRTANPFAILGIAAFAVFDVFDKAFGDWECHLHGAKSLLDFYCHNQLDLRRLANNVPGLLEIVCRLVWFDVMGAVVRGTPGLVFDDWHLECLNDAFFQGVGCPADVFQLFLRVVKREPHSNLVEICFLVMNQLFQLNTQSTDWDQCANAHRCAAVIAVLDQVDDGGSTSKQTLLHSAVQRLCGIVSSTPTSSDFYIHMATTVYLAGMAATTEEQCGVVRSYWRNCCTLGIPRYSQGLSNCEERWKAKGLA